MSLVELTNPLELYMIVKDPELIRRLMANHRPSPITARQLARQLGWSSHSYANRILSGDARSVSVETGNKIAYLLGVPVDLLFMTKASSESQQTVQRKKSA